MALVIETKERKPFYSSRYLQVTVGVVLAIVLGYLSPNLAIDMKPLGDGFIKLIRMVISAVVFCTVVTGIAGMGSMKRVGRVGGLSLLYFEIVSTLALLLGMIVANVFQPGAGLNADPAHLNGKAVAGFVKTSADLNVVDFFLNIVPTTLFDAFAKGDILPVVLVSLLVGYSLNVLGEKAKLVSDFIENLMGVVFTIVGVIMRLAPLGAFGAMAFTVGRYGIESLGPLIWLVGLFYLTGAIFVLGVLGAISAVAGFNILKLLAYLKAEIFITLGTSSSDAALPSLMKKLERAGCSRSVVGLVVPTGYVFNSDGTSIYMTLSALFVAQATNTHLSFEQQLSIFAVAVLTTKGAGGVVGAGFVALVATLGAVPGIPVAGVALILGIDRFMGECRALVNLVGNAVATVVMARVNGELDREQMMLAFNGKLTDAPVEAGAAS
jgi:aerobic C4-dicarboxylate transport protein